MNSLILALVVYLLLTIVLSVSIGWSLLIAFLVWLLT